MENVMHAYSKDELQAIFQSEYNADAWQSLLVNLWGARDLRQTPEKLDASTVNGEAFYLGEITMPDAEVGLFYFRVGSGSVAHKRVGLRNLVKTFINPRGGAFDAALAVFNDGNRWRVSLISDIKGSATAPKRCTFVFGDAGQHYHTAVSRLLKLQSDGASLKTMLDAFSVEALTKEFYKELFGWYQWALSDEMGVTYPNDTSTEADDRAIQEHLIRLITRLMFVWFIKQKKLIPDDIFDVAKLQEMLIDFDPTSISKGDYYNAILQNLFFATLNRPVGERSFAANSAAGRQAGKEHYGIKTLYRDDNKATWFKKSPEEVISMFKKSPFLNGGLFECLDKEKDSNGRIFYYDGFSRESGRQRRAFIPNCLFFDGEKGLISILKRYNFTIEENTPNDVDVALDPELLGKVFENLLGTYNPETKETARKQSGSFYTPREVVNYMVEESLRAYIQAATNYELKFTNGECAVDDMSDEVKQKIYETLLKIKILDPACGSGAFPVGVLNKIIDILKKLNPNINLYRTKLDLIEKCIYGVDIQTIAIQICKLRFFISLVVEQTPTGNPDTNYGILPLPNLESKFIAANTLISLEEAKKDQLDLHDEALKEMKKELWKIRNHCNLRASSWQEKVRLRREDESLCKRIESYLIEHTVKPDERRIAENKNLIEKYEAEISNLKEEWVDDYEAQMSLFGDETPQKLSQKDLNEPKRDELAKLVRLLKIEIQKEERKATLTGLEFEIKKMTKWNPYDQNVSSHFFDPEWMFGLTQENAPLNASAGFFDIVIGNPPYVSAPSMVANSPDLRQSIIESKRYTTLYQKWDLYVPFMEVGLQLLKLNGIFAMIVPYPLTNQTYGKKIRELIVDQYNLIEIVDLNGTKIFDNATVSNCIPFISRSKQRNSSCFISNISEQRKITRSFRHAFTDLVQDKNTAVWNLTTEKRKTNRHAEMNVLGNFCYISKGMVLNADEKTAKGEFTKDDLISKTYDKIHCRKYIEAKDIERYRVKKVRFLEYNTERCPDKLSRPTFRELYELPKLMFNRLGDLQVFLDSETKFLHSDSMFSATLWKDLKNVENKSILASVKRYSKFSRKEMEMLSESMDLRYLLGILNSKYASVLLANLRGGDYHIYPEHLRNLPIPLPSNEQRRSLVSLVEQILLAKKENPAADTLRLENEIDRLVYGLYGLSDDETAVVAKN